MIINIIFLVLLSYVSSESSVLVLEVEGQNLHEEEYTYTIVVDTLDYICYVHLPNGIHGLGNMDFVIHNYSEQKIYRINTRTKKGVVADAPNPRDFKYDIYAQNNFGILTGSKVERIDTILLNGCLCIEYTKRFIHPLISTVKSATLCQNSLIEKYRTSESFYLPEIGRTVSRDFKYLLRSKTTSPDDQRETRMELKQVFEANRTEYLSLMNIPDLNGITFRDQNIDTLLELFKEDK